MSGTNYGIGCMTCGKVYVDGKPACDCRERALQSINQIDRERGDLYWALRTRVLTDHEMRRVQDLGYHICIGTHESYRAESKIAEFNAALLQQYQIRDIANRSQLGQIELLREALRFALDKGLYFDARKYVAHGCPCYEPDVVTIPAELRDLFASITKEPT